MLFWQGTGVTRQLPIVEVVHVVVSGGRFALPAVPGFDGGSAGVGVPASAAAVPPEHASPNAQLKPAPQSASALQGSSYLYVHCLGPGSHTTGGQAASLGQATPGHATGNSWHSIPSAQSVSLVQVAGTQEWTTTSTHGGTGAQAASWGQLGVSAQPPVVAWHDQPFPQSVSVWQVPSSARTDLTDNVDSATSETANHEDSV